MPSVILEYAICKWSNRSTASYFPIHNVYDNEGKNTLFDTFGRQLGDPNFNYPRPPTEEDIVLEEDVKYYRFNSDDENNIIVYRITGYSNQSSGEGGGSIVVDSVLSDVSKNPVQSRAIYKALQERDGRISNASIEIDSLENDFIRVSNSAIPVALKTNLDNIYFIEKGSLTSDLNYWYINPTPYLAYDDSESFDGTWTIYFAGGLPNTKTIKISGNTVIPDDNQVYKCNISQDCVIYIDTSSFTNSQCITFELWLDMPSTPFSFSFESSVDIKWIPEIIPGSEIEVLQSPEVIQSPDFSHGDTRYAVVMRWDGEKILANLAYAELLS